MRRAPKHCSPIRPPRKPLLHTRGPSINEYVSRLSTLRTLFESAHEDITRSEYETFSSRLFEGHSGFLRLAWAPKIRRKERAEYEAAAIADGVSGYFIKSFPDGTVAAECPSENKLNPVNHL